MVIVVVVGVSVVVGVGVVVGVFVVLGVCTVESIPFMHYNYKFLGSSLHKKKCFFLVLCFG